MYINNIYRFWIERVGFRIQEIRLQGLGLRNSDFDDGLGSRVRHLICQLSEPLFFGRPKKRGTLSAGTRTASSSSSAPLFRK